MTAFPADGFFAAAANNAAGKQGLDDLLAAAKQLPGGRVESSLTIASGNITSTAGIHSVDTEAAAASDDLANILTTNLPDGSVQIIRAASAVRVVTVKHQAGGAGQISLVGATDVVLDATSKFLILKRTGTDWEEIGRFGFAAVTGGALSSSIEEKKGANVASATTCDIWAPGDGNLIHITGTTTITSFGTAPQAGAERVVIFDGALTLTHHATTLILPGGANITTAAGDSAIVRADTTANMKVVAYTKANGAPIAGFTGGSLSTSIEEKKGANVASASTCDIWAPGDGNLVHVTGTTTITSFGTAPQAGAERVVIFDGALTLTHHATTLILPGGANITTAAGDSAIVRADTTANMKVVAYTKANGAPIAAAGWTFAPPQAATSGGSLDFTGIPATVQEIVVLGKDVSLGGTDNLLVQIGDSGGVETTGYTSISGDISNNVSSTAGFVIRQGNGANAWSGIMHLLLMDAATNTWIEAHGGGINVGTGGGNKSLSATLDRVRFTRSGSDSFDGSGSVTVGYRN